MGSLRKRNRVSVTGFRMLPWLGQHITFSANINLHASIALNAAVMVNTR